MEFGAWDGKHCSNTYDLIKSHDYRGVFIEADPVRFRDLEQTHGASGRNVLLNAFVGFSKSDSLDVLLSQCEIPKNFDLLSIDIDGNDYHVWEAMEEYRPKLVVIEFNPSLSNTALFVQKRDPRASHGSSPASLVELGKRKGYELVAVTPLSLLFVSSEHYGAFGIADNSLALMRDDSQLPHIFFGYDGHVFLSEGNVAGPIAVGWHHLKLRESDVQALPTRLQKYPDQYSRIERIQYLLKCGLQNPRVGLRKFLHRRDGDAPASTE